MDAKHGYWSVRFNEASSLLTPFGTPFGRYCFLRMPFGLVMSQDVFQRKMDQIMENCPGTIGISDAVIVFRKSEQEHNCNLHKLMQVANEEGLVFNSEKRAIKQQQVKFFGILFDKNGTHPDPVKVEHIKSLPAPKSKLDLREIIGIVTYMSSFIPNLSEHTAVLRDMIKEDTDFIWTAYHEKAPEKVKDLICYETTLAYFDPNQETTIQVDASIKGLGAALMQCGKPIEFASKSLSEAESRYANIERELLAVVFGCERFHTYVFGKHFTVESDHKPLEMIQLKNLTAAPPMLLRMLLRLQSYDISIQYKSGKEMLLADGLSRLQNTGDIQIGLDLLVNFVQFSTEKLEFIQSKTRKDNTLRKLCDVIAEGWPERIRDLPQALKPYWSFRDELSIENCLIVKGERIIIPTTLKDFILDKIHAGHQGMEKCKLRAKECVYWLNINKDIESIVKDCVTCQEFHRSQTKEELQPHELPTRPWQVLCSDLFDLDGDKYLVLCDYYSKFPFVWKMPKYCPSQAVVNTRKQLFSEQGIPERLISDNGGHYDSECFREFVKLWGFQHVTTSPHYPQSNGFAEKTVGSVKTALKKARSSRLDSDMALLCLRTTPVDHQIPRPAELLYNRKLKGNLPVRIVCNSPSKAEISQRLIKRQDTKKRYFDEHASYLNPLKPDQAVRIQDHITKRWNPATVQEQCRERCSYMVRTPNGSVLRRNRRHILDVNNYVCKRVKFDLNANNSTDKPSKTNTVCPFPV